MQIIILISIEVNVTCCQEMKHRWKCATGHTRRGRACWRGGCITRERLEVQPASLLTRQSDRNVSFTPIWRLQFCLTRGRGGPPEREEQEIKDPAHNCIDRRNYKGKTRRELERSARAARRLHLEQYNIDWLPVSEKLDDEARWRGHTLGINYVSDPLY